MSYIPPPSSLPPGSIVDSYRRDSGGSRQDQSTDQQLTEIQAFCKKHNLTLRTNFCDEAKSGGSTTGRDDFNRMVDHFRTPDQRPHGLILWNYARFARDFDNAVYYKSLIRTYKITIHSINDQIPEGDYGRIVEFFIDMSNEEKRRQTSADAKRGLRDLVQKHGCVPGTAPRGFKRVPVVLGQRRDKSDHIAHRWVIDKKIAPRIKKAFALRAAGVSLKDINKATNLYSSYNSYKSFFTNPIYIGILEFGDLTVEKYCEPMIDMPTWNAVQKIVKEYADKRTILKHPRRANSIYLLSGLIYCAQCDSPMNGNTVTHTFTTGRDEAYRCSLSRRSEQCNAGRISRRALEGAVLETLQQYILDPDNLQAIHHIALESYNKFESSRIERSQILTEQKRKLSMQIANITKAIAERGPLKPLLDKLTELNSQRSQTSADLTSSSMPLQPLPPLTPPEISALSTSIIQRLNNSPPEQVKTILQSIIYKVTAQRKDKQIIGAITYIYPPPFDPAPTSGIILPIGSSSVGAPLYRQVFTVPFVYQKPTKSSRT